MSLICRANPVSRGLSRLATVRRPLQPALSLALAVALAFGFFACGGGEDAQLLPGETAREIEENLERVKQLAGEGECVGAADEAREVSNQVEALRGVDAKLKQALRQGTTRLEEAIASCQEATTEALEPTTEETTTTEPPKVPPGHEKHKVPPGQEKKEEREEAEEPVETTPTPPPAEESPPPEPPGEGGGTGAPGGVSPNSPAGGGD